MTYLLFSIRKATPHHPEWCSCVPIISWKLFPTGIETIIDPSVTNSREDVRMIDTFDEGVHYYITEQSAEQSCPGGRVVWSQVGAAQ